MSGELHWKELDTRNVSVGNVHILERVLFPTKARIDAMAKSLSGSLGQLQPILVTKHLHSAWRVVAGATRLLAAKQLGWKHIRATIISANNDIEYQLIEIAENLDRHDLSDNERARLKKKDKELRAQKIAELEAELAEGADKPKPKGGRGKKGGVADAARKAGVPRSTAQDRMKNKKPAENSNPAGLPEPPPQPDLEQHQQQPTESRKPEPTPEAEAPKPDRPKPKPEMIKCWMCHGTGMVARADTDANQLADKEEST
jgi:hypothetical protein